MIRVECKKPAIQCCDGRPRRWRSGNGPRLPLGVVVEATESSAMLTDTSITAIAVAVFV